MKAVLPGGAEIEIGTIEDSPTIGIVDYSRRVTDDFGVTTVVKRGFARRMSVRVAIATDQADTVQRRLAELRATAVRWEADDRFDWLNFQGFYKDFDLDIAVGDLSFYTLTVEGLAETEPGADAGADPSPSGDSTMMLVQPVEYTDATLTASNVPENDYPEWSAVAIYPLGTRVIKVASHRIYESAAAGNQGNDPAGVSGLWIDLGPTNRWAMFDAALGTMTSRFGGLSVTLAPGAIGALALIDVVGSTVRVQSGGYDRTVVVSTGVIPFLDLPIGGAPVTVTISGAGVVSVGSLIVGPLVTLGITEASPKVGIIDFSRKEVDDFGEVTVVPRAWAKRMSANALIRTDALDVVANRIAGVRARPSLWVASEGSDSLTIFGFFKDFSIEVGPTVSKLSLSVEGLSEAASLSPGLPAPNWTDIIDNEPVEHPKPEDGATRGATIGSNIRDETGAVRPATDLINTSLVLTNGGRLLIDRGGGITTPLGEVLATSIGAATEGAMRTQSDALERLAAVVTMIDTRLSSTQEVIRDAGVYVDPTNGKVTISALDATAARVNSVSISLDALTASVALKATTTYVDNAIATAVIDPSQVPVFTGLNARLTSAEVRLDGIDASLLLKADVATVNALSASLTAASIEIDALQGAIVTKVEAVTFSALETRVATAEDSLEALGDVASLTRGITVARMVDRRQEDIAADTLAGLLAGDRRTRDAVQALASAREQITTRLIDGDAAETAARLVLAARLLAAEAGITNEQIVRASADGALAQLLNLVTTTVNGHTATIEQFAESIDGLFARIGFKLNVDGKIVGWVTNNDGVTGGMDFIIDYLRFWSADGSTSKAPFEFRNGGLYVSQLSVDSLSVAGGALGSIVVSTPPQLLRAANDVMVGMIELPTLPPGTNAVRVTMTGDFKIEALAAQHVWARLREVSAAQAAAFKADPGAVSGGNPALPPSAAQPRNSDKLEYVNNVWDNAHLSWIDTAPESGQLYIATLDALSAVDVRWKDVQLSAEIMKRTQIS